MLLEGGQCSNTVGTFKHKAVLLSNKYYRGKV
jgi:hypothetical protein